MIIDYRVKRIFELHQKLESELAKLLISEKYKHLDMAPAERMGSILADRFNREKWKPYISKFYAWFADAYPHSKIIKKADQMVADQMVVEPIAVEQPCDSTT